jgi:hypothetical protein
MSAIPATQRKLRHARETFQLLQAGTRAIPLVHDEVERRLSDFLSAAYSVEDVLKEEVGRPQVDRWLSKLSQRNANGHRLYRFMREQRRVEVHDRGATVTTGLQEISYLEYLERTEAGRSWRHPAYHGMQLSLSGPFGLERPPATVPIHVLMLGDEEVAAKCERYLRLLEQMVQAFLAAYQRP